MHRSEQPEFGVRESAEPSSAVSPAWASERQGTAAQSASGASAPPSLPETVPALLWVADASGRIEYRNSTAAAWLWPADSGEVADLWARTDADHAAMVAGAWQRASAVFSPLEVELPLPSPGGEARWLLVRMSPAGVGAERRWYGLAVDVTQLQASISARVDAQTRQSVEMLAGGVAHAINNQLTVVLASASLALTRCAAGDPARLAFERIQAAGTRAARIATHLLAFSRNQVLLPTAVDLGALVLGLAPTLRDALGPGRRLDVFAAPTPVWAWVDAGRLQQVLNSLLSNARDAGAERVTIRVERVESPILPGRDGPVPGAWAWIEVSDAGAGMPPDVRARAFEPFFTTRPRAAGGGLGLAFVQGTVRQSGGLVGIASREGEGTSVHILLPPPSPPETRDIAARMEAPVRKGASILVVEDEEVVRELIREVLGAAGYRVIVAGSARQARVVIRGLEEAPSALLIDADLGDGGGRELAEAARARWPVPVLYTSGHPQVEVVHQGMVEQGAPFLRKPFLPDELLGALGMLRRTG